jgi:hypothetical protein
MITAAIIAALSLSLLLELGVIKEEESLLFILDEDPFALLLLA